MLGAPSWWVACALHCTHCALRRWKEQPRGGCRGRNRWTQALLWAPPLCCPCGDLTVSVRARRSLKRRFVTRQSEAAILRALRAAGFSVAAAAYERSRVLLRLTRPATVLAPSDSCWGGGRIPLSYTRLIWRHDTGPYAAASVHKYNVLDGRQSYQGFLSKGGQRYTTLLAGLELLASNGSSAKASLSFASLETPQRSARVVNNSVYSSWKDHAPMLEVLVAEGSTRTRSIMGSAVCM